MRKITSCLAWTSVICALGLPYLAMRLGEVEIYHTAGMARYTWLAFFALPIAIGSILCGLYHKKRKEPHGGTIAAGIFCLAVIFCMTASTVPQRGLYDDAALEAVSEVSGVIFPAGAKAGTSDHIQYKLCIATLTEDTRSSFREQIHNDRNWTDTMDPSIKHLLPDSIQTLYFSGDPTFEYFLFLNLNTQQHNKVPTMHGDIPCVFIAYDADVGRIIAVYDYTIDYN